jgi:antagonist of KipI
MSIKVVKPGLLTTIQDLGRYHYGKYGVIVSGAMDRFAHCAANWLVGNDEREATLEITLLGPTLSFEQDGWIAIAGGHLSPTIGGLEVPMWRPVFVRKGAVLAFGKPVAGCRAYLAVAGGVDIPDVMGSKSTYLRAAIGGVEGRAVQAGDIIAAKPGHMLPLPLDRPFAAVHWSVHASIFPAYNMHPTVRVLRGRQFDQFNQESRRAFFEEVYEVTSQSDRMGYRLAGPALSLEQPKELISETVSLGTIQVPSDGNPIILLADRQTLGGYPKIAQVASIDIPVIAQVPPQGKLSFQEIAMEEAEALYLDWGTQVGRLKKMIGIRLQEGSHVPSGYKL